MSRLNTIALTLFLSNRCSASSCNINQRPLVTSHYAPQTNSDLTSEQALFDTSNPLQLPILSRLFPLESAPKAMLIRAVQDLIRQICMTCASHGSAGYAVGNLVVDLTTSDGTWDATVIGLKALLSIVTAASSHPLSKQSLDVEVGFCTSRHLLQ